MTPEEMLYAIQAAVGSLAPVYKDAADESDLYEAALLTIAVEAARLAGGQDLLTNDGVSPASPIMFRRGPGNLWSPGFTFASVGFPDAGKRLEIHLGVYVAGASGVAHECDVALVDGVECDRSRAALIHPRRTRVIAAIEAKHYLASPGIDIGREFLGLGSELGPARSALAFPASASHSLESLLAKKPSECFDEVEPGSSAGQRLSRHLEQRIRNWLP
jgi:hypothetical protein